MKNTLLIIATLLFAASCFKKEAEQAYTCPDGWEGPECATESREKLIGIWSGNDTLTETEPIKYYGYVAKGKTVTQLYLWDFANTTNTLIKGDMSGVIITIPLQKLDDTLLVQGTGILDTVTGRPRISWTYQLLTDSASYSYRGVWRKNN